MLKAYDKLEDVPEPLREHYSKRDDGKYHPDVSDDHPTVKHNAKLLGEKQTAEDRARDLQQQLESAKAGSLPRGHRAVTLADAELVERVKAGGVTKPEEFETLKTEHAELTKKVTEAERLSHIGEVAKAMNWSEEEARLLLPTMQLPELVISDVKENGKDAKKVTAKVRQADGSVVEKPFGEYVEQTPHLKALLPALSPSQGGTRFQRQSSGGAPPPASAVKEMVKKNYPKPGEQAAA